MRSSRLFVLLASLPFVTASAPAAGPPPANALSLREAIAVALQHNPRLATARHQMIGQQGLLRSARALSPLTLQAVPFGTFNDNPLIVSQAFEVVGKRDLRARSARAELDAAEFELQATTLAVMHDGTVAYVTLQEAVAQREAVAQAARLMETLQALTQRRYELGDVPKVHVTRAELELDRARQAVIEATAQVAVKAAGLNAQLGREATTPVEPTDPLTLETASAAEPMDARASALASRPDLRAARVRAVARQAEVRLARRSSLPDFMVQARFGDRTGGTGTQIGFGVSLPLFTWGGMRGETKTARANAAAHSSLVDRAQLEAEAEIESAMRRLAAARTIAESYTQRIVPGAEALARTMRLSYEQGGTTLLEVLDAQRILAATQLERSRALADYHRARAELNRALGRPLLGS